MPASAIALRLVPALLALAQVVLLLAALHVPVRHAMRARGMPRWRLRDTALVSPLALIGASLGLVAANHGMARLAWDVADGQVHVGHALLSAAVAVVGATMAAFGVRAVGKLF